MVHNAYAPTEPKPSAYIAVNKNRLKSYDGKVYLKDRQTFQIEVYNPTQKVLLAVFYINGTVMPGGGLILKPAERVFLDRYLTEKRKLMFNTYVASGTSEEVARAISNNGQIEVKFYEEYIELPYFNGPFNYTDTVNTVNTGNFYYDYFTPDCDYLGATGSDNINTRSFSKSISQAQLGFCDTEMSSEIEQETGRIDKGGVSVQDFQYVDKVFSSIQFHNVSIQLLPVSQKCETATSIRRRVYCTECGAKASKVGAKFCSECGTRL